MHEQRWHEGTEQQVKTQVKMSLSSQLLCKMQEEVGRGRRRWLGVWRLPQKRFWRAFQEPNKRDRKKRVWLVDCAPKNT